MGKESDDNEKVENIVAFTIIAVIIIIGIGFWNNWWGAFDQERTDGQTVTTPLSNEPGKGSEEAPVTIVEYSDFECPFCARFHSETLPQIMEEYVETGQVRFVYKNYPLTRIHERAMPAAIASECAYRQGEEEFWAYHDLLFENQDNLSDDALRSYAEQSGLDTQSFNLCFGNEETRPEVQEDFREGTESSVTGTPAFIIGETGYPFTGKLLVGNQPFSAFQQAIEEAN